MNCYMMNTGNHGHETSLRMIINTKRSGNLLHVQPFLVSFNIWSNDNFDHVVFRIVIETTSMMNNYNQIHVIEAELGFKTPFHLQYT